MTPGRYPLGPIYRGDTYVWRVVLWFDAMRAQPADLTGYVAKAEIRNAPGSGAFIQHINADIILPNTIDVMISTGASSNLPDTTLVWDLQLTDPRNHVSTILRGDVSVVMDVTESTIEPVVAPSVAPSKVTMLPARSMRR